MTSDEVRELANRLNKLSRELVEDSTIELTDHDVFYLGYIVGVLSKISDALLPNK